MDQINAEGLEVLARPDCLALLARHALGRVSVSIGALPAILPVTYRLSGEAVVLRTTPGTRFDAAVRNAVVAFEVDDLDEVTGAGWSVMVTGFAEEIVGPELDWAHTLGLPSWADDGGTRFVRIPCAEVTGRRIGGWGRSAPGPGGSGPTGGEAPLPATTPQIHSRF